MHKGREINGEPREILEDRVARLTFLCSKLQRDGGYPCEIQAAQKALRGLEEALRTARRHDG